MYDDEKEYGLDPQTKRYFKKIAYSYTWGLLWMMFVAFFGLYFGLFYISRGVTLVNIIFFAVVLITFLVLVRYLYRTWRPEKA
jgi:hypothetical protein